MNIDPFVYQPPTHETAPRFKAIRAAAEAASAVIRRVLSEPIAESGPQAGFAEISDACRALYVAIQEHAPASADRSAAERCARIARMASNDAHASHGEERVRRTDVALTQVDMARWQACAAIALPSLH